MDVEDVWRDGGVNNGDKEEGMKDGGRGGDNVPGEEVGVKVRYLESRRFKSASDTFSAVVQGVRNLGGEKTTRRIGSEEVNCPESPPGTGSEWTEHGLQSGELEEGARLVVEDMSTWVWFKGVQVALDNVWKWPLIEGLRLGEGLR